MDNDWRHHQFIDGSIFYRTEHELIFDNISCQEELLVQLFTFALDTVLISKCFKWKFSLNLVYTKNENQAGITNLRYMLYMKQTC